MATFPGNAVPSVLLTSSFGLDDFESKDLVPQRSAYLLTLPMFGIQTSTQPVNENPVTHVGYAVELYGFLHFYNKIHFQYPELNLGNVLGDQQVSFWVFNAFFEPTTLETIEQIIGTEDLNLEPGEDDTPILFAPFEQLFFELSIPASGPPNVDVTYEFDFTFITIELHVFGSRLVLFPYIPQSDIDENLEFSTVVDISDDESERRARLRNPRQRLTYEILSDDIASADMQSLLFDWQPRVFGVPVWFEARYASSTVEEGSFIVPVNTAYGDFRVGGLLFIYQDRNNFEAQAITEVNTNAIEVQSPVSQNFERSLIMPIRDCYASNSIARSKYPVNATRTMATFLSLTNVNLADTTGATFYDSRVVLTDVNFMGGSNLKPYDLSRAISLIDTKSGSIYQTSQTDRSKIRTSKVWSLNTMVDIWRIRRLLHYLTGQKSFWVPSGMHDLMLLQDIAAGATTLRIANVSYSTFIRQRRPLADIRISLKDGSQFFRRIIDSNADGQDEVLSLNAAVSDSVIFVNQVYKIDFLMLMRIDGDKANIGHPITGKAIVSVNLVSVFE
jgi:hypothetical protein